MLLHRITTAFSILALTFTRFAISAPYLAPDPPQHPIILDLEYQLSKTLDLGGELLVSGNHDGSMLFVFSANTLKLHTLNKNTYSSIWQICSTVDVPFSQHQKPASYETEAGDITTPAPKPFIIDLPASFAAQFFLRSNSNNRLLLFDKRKHDMLVFVREPDSCQWSTSGKVNIRDFPNADYFSQDLNRGQFSTDMPLNTTRIGSLKLYTNKGLSKFFLSAQVDKIINYHNQHKGIDSEVTQTNLLGEILNDGAIDLFVKDQIETNSKGERWQYIWSDVRDARNNLRKLMLKNPDKIENQASYEYAEVTNSDACTVGDDEGYLISRTEHSSLCFYDYYFAPEKGLFGIYDHPASLPIESRLRYFDRYRISFLDMSDDESTLIIAGNSPQDFKNWPLPQYRLFKVWVLTKKNGKYQTAFTYQTSVDAFKLKHPKPGIVSEIFYSRYAYEKESMYMNSDGSVLAFSGSLSINTLQGRPESDYTKIEPRPRITNLNIVEKKLANTEMTLKFQSTAIMETEEVVETTSTYDDTD